MENYISIAEFWKRQKEEDERLDNIIQCGMDSMMLSPSVDDNNKESAESAMETDSLETEKENFSESSTPTKITEFINKPQNLNVVRPFFGNEVEKTGNSDLKEPLIPQNHKGIIAKMQGKSRNVPKSPFAPNLSKSMKAKKTSKKIAIVYPSKRHTPSFLTGQQR